MTDRTRARLVKEIRAWLKNGASDFAEIADRFEKLHPDLAWRVTTRELAVLIEEARGLDRPRAELIEELEETAREAV